MTAKFALDSSLDVRAAGEAFRKTGRAQIINFLAGDSAESLRDELRDTHGWRHVINGKDQVFEAASDDYDKLPTATRDALRRAMEAQAAVGFQFSYDTIRLTDDPLVRSASTSVLARFGEFMGDSATLAKLQEICGGAEFNFADAQATRYRAGDFLTRHDDCVAGKHRVAAYVLGLVENWRAEWGGLLTFVDLDGQVVDTLVPSFNTLCLFNIGQPHFVSPVASYALGSRLAVTGWLRNVPI